MKRTFQRALAALFCTAAIASCGAKTGLPVPDPPEVPEPVPCVSLQTSAGLADLDVFNMVDVSGSMEYQTADGTTKWDAMRAAFQAFLTDADSAGIGVALTFFPVVDPNVPEVCTTENACGNPISCKKYSMCFPDGGELCDTQADCADAGFPNDTCEPLGFCENNTEQVCLVNQSGIGCEAADGACLNAGLCDNHFDCSINTYQNPVVDVTVLPEGATAVLSAMNNTVPDGGTTTLPALAGAIQKAISWTNANPTHKAIVVLATDGLPTNCDPALDSDTPELGIQHLVDVAAEGAKAGVQTFVIGVFNPEEAAEAAPNLDAIAKGGGTDNAFLISTESNVTKALVEALNEVRLTSTSCELAIPLVNGQLPDLTHLTVEITPPNSAPVEIPYRESGDNCHPTEGGYYFNTPLGDPTPPSRIILCPTSCALFGTTANRIADLKVACDE
ncbi:MAG: VWA domain-containing protein [Polyangiaceae bacterium]|nr:VWA domain-containing protein [Polyangiaceae bacterium]